MFFVARKHQVAGSSPRLRGTLSRTERRSCSRRFIPAFAGNATREIDAERELPVHPRVCGERSFQSASIHATAGSSPRLRGTRPGGGLQQQDVRFIPAFAGNARGTPRPRCPRPGSSPRLRGTHVGPHPADLHNRFIPAFAGNA